ncbi:unnamed protein product [Rotaria magnacalcarata]|uniref:Histone H2A C-terminal domain-containing protein n=2 Tax=Rotaria magnacalcarata TaxID=392030 RepID=A0A815LJ87_9BILA|nr:unnamed protein product [Rotaria magnacalcarata]CAF1409118.1 unnamed protein product [Rotaria magnacalcarata]CAF4404754.1 unnamed protein product [Rotaria magnacalcarata]
MLGKDIFIGSLVGVKGDVDKLATLEDEQKRKCDAAYEAVEETKRQQKSSEEIKKLIKIANKEELQGGVLPNINSCRLPNKRKHEDDTVYMESPHHNLSQSTINIQSQDLIKNSSMKKKVTTEKNDDEDDKHQLIFFFFSSKYMHKRYIC